MYWQQFSASRTHRPKVVFTTIYLCTFVRIEIVLISFTAWKQKFIVSTPGFIWLDENCAISSSLRSVETIDHHNCQKVCVDTENCVGYTFWEDKNQCDVKNEFQAFTNLTSDGSEVSGIGLIHCIKNA